MQTITVTVNNSKNAGFLLELMRKLNFIKSAVTVETKSAPHSSRGSFLTAQELLNSGIIGIWKNRKDIKSSRDFARKMRQQAQKRLQ